MPTVSEVLERARDLGFLGPGPVEQHVRHARAMAAVIAGPTSVTGAAFPPDGPARFADLGSGGGVPGLVLLDCWPGSEAILIEAGERRCAFLRESVEGLGRSDRVLVLEERAEVSGRRPELRGSLALVTARSFSRPAVTAECAAPLLAVGGVLVVSEPPEQSERWPLDGLAELGLRPVERGAEDGFHFQLLEQVGPCPDRYPRRTGVPERRPLF